MVSSALEINSKFIRAILLGRAGQNLSLKKIAEAPLPDGLIINGRLIDPKNFAQILKNFLRRNHFSSSHWIVSLPEGAIFTAYKTFPNLPEESLKEAVELNAPTLLPGKIEEISWGWQMLDKEVMVSSIAKRDLANYLLVFDQLGLVPIAIEPKSCSIARTFGQTDNIMVLNVEGEILTSVIINEGFPKFAREFQVVGDKEKQFKNLITEARRVMNFYLTETKQKQISSIILDGSGAKEELAYALKQTFHIDVKTTPEIFQISGFRIQSLPLVGAGLRALLDPRDDSYLSLLPVGTKAAAQEKRTLLFYGGVANMVVVTSLLLVAIFFGSLLFLRILEKNLDGQLASLVKGPVDNSGQAEIEQNIAQLNPYLEKEAKIEDGLTFWSGPLEKIAQNIPQGINLTQINYPGTGETITMIGQATSRDILANFRDLISGFDFVSSVQMPSSNFSQTQAVDFTLSITLKKEALSKK